MLYVTKDRGNGLASKFSYKNETSFVSPKGPKAQASKTRIDFMIFVLNFRGKLFVIRCYA